MEEDRKQETLRRYASELVALEGDLEAAVDRQRESVHAYPDVAAALEHFHGMIATQKDALRSYLESVGGQTRPVTSQVVASFHALAQPTHARHRQSVTDTLRADFAAFNYAAISYAVLFEMALRLYDAPLRELAPRHLQQYAEAAQTISQIIVRTTAGQLAEAGLECLCVCPMCSIGACGCVSVGTAAVNSVWRETSSIRESAPGFLLQPPRSNSSLALAGVQGGDCLLEVDGQRVQAIGDIQAAIRKHPIGGDVRLLVKRSLQAPREIQVKHVGDYPET